VNNGLLKFPRKRGYDPDVLNAPLIETFGDWVPHLPPVTDYSSWYDMADASTITVVSSAISQWNDKGPGGFNLTQGTSTRRPVYSDTLSQINGFLTGDWDGNDDFLSNASFPFFTRPATYMNAILIKSALSSERRLWDATSGNIWLLSFLDRNRMAFTKAGGSTVQMSQQPVPILEACFICWVFTSTACTFYVNSYSETKSDSQTAAGSGLALGARSTGASGTNCRVLDAFYWNRALSAAEVTLMRKYLSQKWAMPDYRGS
jgi:hypothetical protein